jgi:hypothetical protein
MPISHNTNVDYVARLIRDNEPKTVLDVGAGAGKYGHLYRAIYPYYQIDALEVWEPYIEEYNLNYLYNNIFKEDVRSFDNFNYDLVILGDILEHMEKEEAIRVMESVKSQAKMAIISIPTCDCPQGHIHGNPYEEHVKDDWTHEEVMETFSHIFQYELFQDTGTYFLDYQLYEDES